MLKPMRVLLSVIEGMGAHPDDQTGFIPKCQNILDLVINDLASNAHIFMNAVDPKEVPDYYNIVKAPMDLTTISNKLAAGAYTKGTEFAEVSNSTTLVVLYKSTMQEFSQKQAA